MPPNLPDVLRFLDTRVGQISGCRDRRGEGAVAPEDLGCEFHKSLLGAVVTEEEKLNPNDEKKCCDEVGILSSRKWADLLTRLEARAKEGWGCNSWKDFHS